MYQDMCCHFHLVEFQALSLTRSTLTFPMVRTFAKMEWDPVFLFIFLIVNRSDLMSWLKCAYMWCANFVFLFGIFVEH